LRNAAFSWIAPAPLLSMCNGGARCRMIAGFQPRRLPQRSTVAIQRRNHEAFFTFMAALSPGTLAERTRLNLRASARTLPFADLPE